MSQLITSEVLNSGKKFRLESSAGGTLREAKMGKGSTPIVRMTTADMWMYPDLDLVAEILPTKSVNTNNQYVALKVSGSDLYIKHVPNQAIFRLTRWDNVEDNKALFAFYRTPSNAIKIKCVLDFPGNFWDRGFLKAGDSYLEVDDPQGSDFNLRYFSSAPVQSPVAITVAAADSAAAAAAQAALENPYGLTGTPQAAAAAAAKAVADQAAAAAAAAGDARYAAAAARTPAPVPAPVPVPFSTPSRAPVPAPASLPVPVPASLPVPAPFSTPSRAPVPVPAPVPIEEGIPWWVWLIVVLILLGAGVYIYINKTAAPKTTSNFI